VADDRALTPRQQRFVDEYLVDLNATQAAIRAGYSAKTAEQQGPRLLGNVGVAAGIAAGKAKRAAKVGLSQERVLEEVEGLAHSDVTHYVFDDEANQLKLAPGAPPNAMRAVSSVKYRSRTDEDGNVTRECEFKLWDKPGMVKLAGRHLGIKGFFEKVELSGPDGGPVEVRAVKDMSSGERRKRIAELAARRLPPAK
jgi:phage terminase small subunit